ncbi:MAG: hypothetical protein Ct9H300mP28_18860 [Pseudomonadota bacterium]|nr:MAG: hypothetical protein Ct9H300mP28_18860 [Pseudomonadota bacterium]
MLVVAFKGIRSPKQNIYMISLEQKKLQRNLQILLEEKESVFLI